MATFGKTIRVGVAAALLLAGITTGVQGQVPGGMGSLGGEGRGMMQIKGKVVCAGCSLEEARKAQPREPKLYQLTHRRGQVVMKVSWVNESQMWSNSGSSRLWVRAKDRVFQQLAAEENLFKEVEITGLLNNSRTLDIFGVTIRG